MIFIPLARSSLMKYTMERYYEQHKQKATPNLLKIKAEENII